MENDAKLKYWDGLNIRDKVVECIEGRPVNHFSIPIDKHGEGKITIMVAKSDGSYSPVTIFNHKNGASVICNDDTGHDKVTIIEDREVA